MIIYWTWGEISIEYAYTCEAYQAYASRCIRCVWIFDFSEE
jgi:hypothetical protein